MRLVLPIIGLAGFARSGKDTVADILVRDYGYTRYAFADPLKNILYSMDDTVRRKVDMFGWDEAKQTGNTRVQLQELGMAIRQQFGSEILLQRILKVAEPPFVISDVRLPFEARAVHIAGGVIFRVDRPGVGPANNHATEGVLPAEQVILNDGTIEDLAQKVRECIDNCMEIV